MKLNKNVGVPLPVRFSVWFTSDTKGHVPIQLGLLRRSLILQGYENKGFVFIRNFKNLLSSYGAPLVINEEDVTTVLTVTQLKIISLCCITESSRLKLINLNTGEEFVGSNAIEEALKSVETSK